MELFDVVLVNGSKEVVEWRNKSACFAIPWCMGFNKAQEQRRKPWRAKVRLVRKEAKVAA